MLKFEIKQPGVNDLDVFDALLDCFAEVFEDRETYQEHKPDDVYVHNLIESGAFIPLTAIVEGRVVGGLAAYELKKFEQKRSEIYIYDLAVKQEFRRNGIATGLIDELKQIARSREAWVIFVQADLVDEPAIKLYSKLGAREDVLHFDIEP